MNLKVESRTLSIKGYAITSSDVIQVVIKIAIENIGESITYIHKPDKNLELGEKTPDTVSISVRCNYPVPNYVKEIVNITANGLGKATCKSNTVLHKCTVPEISLSKEQILEILDTIIEAIEIKQPEIL